MQGEPILFWIEEITSAEVIPSSLTFMGRLVEGLNKLSHFSPEAKAIPTSFILIYPWALNHTYSSHKIPTRSGVYQFTGAGHLTWSAATQHQPCLVWWACAAERCLHILSELPEEGFGVTDRGSLISTRRIHCVTTITGQCGQHYESVEDRELSRERICGHLSTAPSYIGIAHLLHAGGC